MLVSGFLRVIGCWSASRDVIEVFVQVTMSSVRQVADVRRVQTGGFENSLQNVANLKTSKYKASLSP